jgi:hypothetical protein
MTGAGTAYKATMAGAGTGVQRNTIGADSQESTAGARRQHGMACAASLQLPHGTCVQAATLQPSSYRFTAGLHAAVVCLGAACRTELVSCALSKPICTARVVCKNAVRNTNS